MMSKEEEEEAKNIINEIKEKIHKLKRRNLKAGSVLVDSKTFYLIRQADYNYIPCFTPAHEISDLSYDKIFGLPLAVLTTQTNKKFIEVYAK